MGVGLSGESHNEGRAQGEVRHQFARSVEDFSNMTHVARPVHCPEDLRISVLQRHIQVLYDLVQSRHRLEEILIHPPRIAVMDPKPWQVWDTRADRFQKAGEW